MQTANALLGRPIRAAILLVLWLLLVADAGPAWARPCCAVSPLTVRHNLLYDGLGGGSFAVDAQIPASTIPAAKRDDRWLAADKGKHVVATFLITLGMQYVTVNKLGYRESPSLPFSAGTAAGVGLAKEFHDAARKPGGIFSGKDLVADFVGIVAAALVISI